MKLLKQRLINYLNYTNIHEYSSDIKTKKVPQTGALPSSIIYILLTQLVKEALLLQNFEVSTHSIGPQRQWLKTILHQLALVQT